MRIGNCFIIEMKIRVSCEVIMHKKYFPLVFIFTLSLILTYAVPYSAASEAPRITKEELSAMLNSPDLVIIDVRVEKEWKKADTKIKGAVWEDSEEIEKWAGKYPKDKTIVFY